MGDFLKKIGIPATLASLVGASVTAAAFMFQVDSRYAKADDVEAKHIALAGKIDALTAEVSRVAGATEVLIQVSGRLSHVTHPIIDKQLSRSPASRGQVSTEEDNPRNFESLVLDEPIFIPDASQAESAPPPPPPPPPVELPTDKTVVFAAVEPIGDIQTALEKAKADLDLSQSNLQELRENPIP